MGKVMSKSAVLAGDSSQKLKIYCIILLAITTNILPEIWEIGELARNDFCLIDNKFTMPTNKPQSSALTLFICIKNELNCDIY